jgi:hypothetical protein
MFGSVIPRRSTGPSGRLIQRLSPNGLFEADRAAFERLIANLRELRGMIDWKWAHISERHVLDELEEGEVRQYADMDTAYFEVHTREEVFDLIGEAIVNGKRGWEGDRDVVWFRHRFDRPIGAYPDGTLAYTLHVYIDVSAVDNENDVSDATIETAIPKE